MDGNRLIDKLRKHKIKQKQKYQYYDNLMQPAKNAKKECIHFLASLGRNHKILKWPIFIMLVAFIFVYNFIYYALVNLRVREKFARGLAMFMTAVLVLTSVDLTALAIQNTEKSRQYYEVTGFEEEFSDTLEVPFGTEIEDMELPETIVANVDLYELTSDKDKEGEGAEKTPTPTPSASPTPSATPSQTPTATPTEEAAESPTPTPSDEAVESPVPTETPEGDVTPTVEPTAPEDPSAVPTQEPTPEEQTNPEQPEQGSENNPEETQPEENNQEESQPEEPASEENNSSDNGDGGEGTEETPHELPENYSEITENVEIQEMTAEETVNEDEDTSDDNDEPNAEEGSEEDGVSDGTEGEDTYEVVESTSIELAVTWKCEEYDPLVEGEYIFVPEMPEEYDGITVKCAIEQPSITVIVGEAKAIKLSTVVDGIEIVLEAEAGVFAPNVTLSATRVVDEAIEDLINDKISNDNSGNGSDTELNGYMAFDIVVLDKNGEEVQPKEVPDVDPSKAVTVTFKKIGDKIREEGVAEDEQNMDVFYVDDDFSSIENVTSTEDGDDVSFNPEHFSLYVCTCTHTGYKTVTSWSALYSSFYQKEGTVNVRLGADITEGPLTGYSTEKGLYIGGSNLVANLDLNGYSLTGESGRNQVILITDGANFDLHDSVGGGFISANDNNYAIRANGGSVFTIYGGTVSNSKGSGTTVKVESGSYGNIIGGNISGAGTGISSASNSYVTLSNATVTGHKKAVSTVNGSIEIQSATLSGYTEDGVYINNPSSGTIKIADSTISGDSAYKTIGINCYSGSEFSLGSGVTMSNKNSDIYIYSFTEPQNSDGDNKASTLINLTACPSNSLSIAIGDMSINSGAVEFTKNYVSGAEDKFYSSVSTSYDVWKATNSLFIGAQPDCNIKASMKPISLQFPNDASKVNLEAGTVKIGSGETSNTTAISKVKYGATVTMTAAISNPEAYTFKGWYKGEYSSSATPVSTSLVYVFVAKQENENYTAVFQKKQFTVMVKAGDSNKGSVSLKDAKGNNLSGMSTTQDIGEKIKIVATGKTYNSKIYEFAQWNDGDKTSPREIVVKENITYTAQYKLPDPDPNATGTYYTNVKLLTSQPSTGINILLIGSGNTVDVPPSGNIVITTLPDDAARVTSGIYGYSNSASSVVVSGLKNDGGTQVKIDSRKDGSLFKGKDFDTCPGGIIKYYNGNFYYWCKGGAKDGIGPYTAYSFGQYEEFKAGNITAHLKPDSGGSIKLSEDQTKVVEGDLVVNINQYTAINIDFSDNDINYVNGDRTVSMNIGGVAFTYVLPEAQIGDKEYSDLEAALKAVKTGETIYAVGQAVSEVTGYDVGGETEYVTVPQGVNIVNYDGSKFTTDVESQVTIDSNGIVTLVKGKVTATPNGTSGASVKVGADDGFVTSDVQITVESKEDGNLVVVPSSNTEKIVISPDGNAEHTVTYNGCSKDTEYGINSGVLTNEKSVEITDGTLYDLSVNLNGNETTVETSPTNSGKTVITKGENEGGDYLKIESKAEHDDFVINTGEEYDTTYSTNTEETIIIVAPGNKTFEEEPSNEVVLEKGSVDVSSGGEIKTKDGTTFKNTNSGGEKITVNADDTTGDSGEVSVPSGGSAEVTPPGQNPIYISVPKPGEGQAENSPVVIKTNDEGGVSIEADAGSPVTIRMPDESGNPGTPVTYNTGDFETVIDIVVGDDGEPQVVVSDGSVILEPGQSITDANGVTFTNPPAEEGQPGRPITLNITEGEPTSVQTEGGGNFEYQLPGEDEPRQFDNPSIGGATFDVTKDGDVSLNSDVEFESGSDSGVTVSTGEGDTEVKPDVSNQGKVKVDTTENTITVEKEGDKVTIGGQTYETTNDRTVIKVGDDGPELVEGGVNLVEGEGIIVNGTNINADSDGVSVETDPSNPEKINVKVEEGGTFFVEQPGNSSTAVKFTNDTEGGDATYEIDPSGGIKIPADTTTVCRHGEDEVKITPSSDEVTITPSTDGVSITTPKKEEGATEPAIVEINGKEYVNESEDSDLVLSVDGDDVILKQGEVTVPEGGGVTLYNGDVVSVSEGTAKVDDTGNIEVPENGKITISDPSGDSVIKSLDDDTKILIDPETGTTVLKDGSVEIGKGSGLNVVYEKTPVYDGGEIVDYEEKIMNIESTGDVPAEVKVESDGTGTIEVPKGGSVRIESSTEEGDTATNVVKVPEGSSGGVTIKTQTDGSVDAELGNGESVSVNGNEYTAKESSTKINVGGDGATLDNGSVALDPGESINAGGSNVSNSGSKGTEVVIHTEVTTTPSGEENRETTIEAPKGGKFTLSEEGKTDGYTFTNPSSNSETYTVNNEGNLVLEDGAPIQAKVGGKDIEISGPSGDDIELKVTQDGINLKAESGDDIKVGSNTVKNTTPTGEEFNLVVDDKGEMNLFDGDVELPTGSKVNVIDSNGQKTKIENTGNSEETEVKVSDDGNVTFSHKAPEEGESDPSNASVKLTGPDGTTNTYMATEDGKDIVIKTDSGSSTPELVSGTVELKGGNEPSSIVVNGLSVSNEGTQDGVVVSKTDEGGTPTTSLKVEPGSSFGLSSPGNEDDAYIFTNPSSAPAADYNVDTNGNLELNPGSSISFKDSNGKESTVSIPSTEQSSKITVDEDGVKIIAENGKLVEVNGVKYRNHSPEQLILSVDEEGDTILKQGTTGLREGEHITVETKDETGQTTGKVKVTMPPIEGTAPPADYIAADGTITSQNLSERKYILTDDKGQTTEITTKPSAEQAVQIKATEDGFVLEKGTVEVPKGSEVIVNGSVIANTGDEGSVIDVKKNESGSTEFTLGEGASFAMADPKGESKYEFKNPQTAQSNFTLDSDGNITLGEGSSLSFGQKGEEPTIIENASAGTGVKVTQDGVTLNIPQGGSVTIGGIEYKNNDDSAPMSIAINEEGEAVLVDGTIQLDAGQTINVKDSTGKYVPVEGTGAVVNDNGEVSVPADTTVTIGDHEYNVNSPTGATIEVPGAGKTPVLTSGSVDLKEDDAIAVTTGTSPESIQTVTNKGNVDPEAEPSNIKVSSDGTLNVPNGTKLDVKGDSKENGEGLKVESTPGATVVINDGTYESKDTSGSFKLDVNGNSGEVKLDGGVAVEVTNGNLTVGGTTISTTGDKPVSVKDNKGSLKPDIFVEPGGNVTIGSTTGQGKVEVKIPADTEEEPKDPKKVSIDSSGNVSVEVEAGEEVTVGGITYTAGTEGKIVVNGQTGALDTNKTNALPASMIDPSSFNKDTYSYKVPAGSSVDVGGVTYVAPKTGMTLIGNENGNPVIQVAKAGSTVTVNGKEYTTGSDNAQFVVNNDGSVTLKNAGSSLNVSGNTPIEVDGNKYTGSKDGSYTVTHTSEGDVVSTKNGSNVSVTVGQGNSVILDGVKNDKGDNIVITSGTSTPTTVVVDKTKMGDNGSYQVDIIAGGNTVLKPVYDSEGKLIGYETAVKPAPAPSHDDDDEGSSSGSGDSSGLSEPAYVPAVKAKASPSPMVSPMPLPTGETTAKVTTGKKYTLKVNNGEIVNTENEDNPDTGLNENGGDNPETTGNTGTTENVPQTPSDDENIPNVTETEFTLVEVAEDEVIPEIPVIGEVEVDMGTGKINVTADGGNIKSLPNVIKACLNNDDLNSVKSGSNIRIRLKIDKLAENIPQKEKDEMMAAFAKFAPEVDGLTFGDYIDVSLEMQVDDGEWTKLHDLNEEIEIEMDVPENLQKDGRTFWVMRNHEGECDMLDDIDSVQNTVTFKTKLFSAYALYYTDAPVEPGSVHFSTVNTVTVVTIIALALIVAAGLFMFFVVYKRRKDEEEA